jgi:hypothetical protein
VVDAQDLGIKAFIIQLVGEPASAPSKELQ